MASTTTPKQKQKPLKQRLGREQVEATIKALLTHVENKRKLREKAQLLLDADVLSIIVALNKTPEQGKSKPIFVSIPHPIRPKSTTICLFVKDNVVAKIKEFMREQAPTLHCKVMGLTKLRKNYHEHSAKRELCSKYDLFLADDRIVAMLTKPLGKAFFRKKKQPVPIRVTGRGEALVHRIERVRDNTHMYINWGNCCAVRLATSDQSQDEIVDNIMDGTAAVVHKLPEKWKGVQAIHVKTTDSIALPLYHSVAHLDRIDKAAIDKDDDTTPTIATATKKDSGDSRGTSVSGKRRRGETKAKVKKKKNAKQKRKKVSKV